MPLVFVVAVVLTMVLLMRNRVLKEKYAVWWAVVSIAVLVAAIFPQFLVWLSRIVGFATPANFTFFSGVLLLLVISVQFSVELSRLEDKARRLAEESAILRATIERLEDGAQSGLPDDDDAQA
jgi:hypothetical protein